MRRIDYWVGIPVCFLASFFIFFIENFQKNSKFLSSKKILFIELSEMGSAILADPALRKASVNGEEIFFLIFSSNRESLELLNTVNQKNIVTINNSNLFSLVVDTFRFLVFVRQNKIDTVIDLELFSRYTGLLSGLSGARKRIGFDIFHGEGLWRGSLLTHKVAYNPHIHIAKNFVSLVYAAQSSFEEVPFSKIFIDDSEIKLKKIETDLVLRNDILGRIINLTRNLNIPFEPGKNRIILINPNASELLPQRRYPQEKFSELIKKINELWPSDLILITGSKGENDYVETIRNLAKVEKALNFTGKILFKELPALYDLSEIMVTNDSGPGHFSSVTSLKTIILFGPETPSLYGSLGNSVHISANLACSPCVSAINHRQTACKDNVCMKKIEVSSIISELKLNLN